MAQAAYHHKNMENLMGAEGTVLCIKQRKLQGVDDTSDCVDDATLQIAIRRKRPAFPPYARIKVNIWYFLCGDYKNMSKKSKKDHMVWDALIMVFQFGINMLVPIFICTLLGVWLGDKLDKNWIAIPLFFIGAVAGGQNIYRMAKKFMK